jgi:Carboxypeptidase regulatory-like domain
MKHGPSLAFVRDLDILYQAGTAGGLTDRELLGRNEALAASSTVMALAESALSAMFRAKVKLTAGLLVVLLTFATTLAQTERPALPGQGRAARNRGVLPAQTAVPLDTPGQSGRAVDSAPPAQVPQQGAVDTPKPNRALNLEVMSGAENVLLPGALVWIQLNRTQPFTFQGRTDNDGHYAIALPAGAFSWLRIGVVHPGFAPQELFWSGEEPIPDSYTVSLERGVPIGGNVRDEQGRPIAGATVHLHVWASPPRGRPERYPDPMSEFAAAVTDEAGRWRSEALPASATPGVKLELLTTHPDHIALRQPVTAESLRGLASAGVMRTGRSVAGTVFSPTGRPVAGATIVVQNSNNVGSSQRHQTDDHGGFRTGWFIDPTWDKLTVTVQADGFASAIRRLVNAPEIPPQIVRLLPRKPLRGRVVDSQGRSIAGALVAPTLGLANGRLDWEARTDEFGRFQWFESPASGTILLDVRKRGFRQIQYREVAAGMEDLTLTLHRPPHLHGTVTDAETGRPIERFTLLSAAGAHHPGLPAHWDRDNARSYTNGQFDFTGDSSPDQDSHRSIRIEADGYLAGELRDFPDNEEDVTHSFRLRRSTRKAIAPTGIVRGPDGRPLAGAEVLLGDRDVRVGLRDGRTARQGLPASHHVRTDRDGRYTFPPRAADGWIVAVHDAGFALRSPADLAASTDLTLVPWGRIEGILRIGANPAPGQKVSAYLQDRRFPGWVSCDSQSDRDGRFIFERVAPGRLTIYRPVRQAEGQTLSNLTHIDVAPGQTVRLQLGGTGRPVVGRLALPAGVAMKHFVGGYCRLQSEPPPLPLPAGSAPLTDEQWSSWWDAFRETPECEDYFFGEHQYAVTFGPEGTFRIEDVPAGRYVLNLPFSGNAGADQSARRAFAQVAVVVPAIPGGRSDEPLDIGTFPLEVFPFHELGAGDRVPPIASKAADGRPLDLARLRGKFVLLVFWCTSRPMSLRFVPPVKATWDAFGRDPRLVIIGLNQDAAPEVLRRYLARGGLDWEQRYIGSSDDPNPIAAAFGVRFPGGVFLIGPDGRIVAKDLQGEAIKQAVAKALKVSS